MQYVPNLTDIKVNDVITTAGIDGVYPKGIPIGRVAKVEEGKELFKLIVVQSSIDFANLEDVMIIHTKKIPEAVIRYPERSTTTTAGAARP